MSVSLPIERFLARPDGEGKSTPFFESTLSGSRRNYNFFDFQFLIITPDAPGDRGRGGGPRPRRPASQRASLRGLLARDRAGWSSTRVGTVGSHPPGRSVPCST